ncbi:MAG: hypothetical protein A6F70_10720 [Cycloclasticus sp. symbiont of Bathymodiolus heckerae]|nr:MAG: hypothetical protein A6F70_10720 [Cycloclasticus sp. symbiont of Bathymodiolus heckerae]
MTEENFEITIDPLFVGLTRPATLLGIPYFATVIEFMATLIIFLAIGNPLYLLIAVPFHAILYVISATDDARFNHAYSVVSQNIYLLHNSASTELCMCRTLEHWAKT